VLSHHTLAPLQSVTPVAEPGTRLARRRPWQSSGEAVDAPQQV